MEQKSAVLINKGMNRDLSVSKIDGSSAYKNKNIRITVDEHDTLLSVTNERGTKAISLTGTIDGDLVGWNVLNNHIILFTHKEGEGPGRPLDYPSSGGLYQNTAIVKDEEYGAQLGANVGTDVLAYDVSGYDGGEVYIDDLGEHTSDGFSYLIVGESDDQVFDYSAEISGYSGKIEIPSGAYTLYLIKSAGHNTGAYEVGGLKDADKIYRIDYDGSSFSVNKGRGSSITHEYLYAGQLGFDPEFPIESVVYFESEDVQKIYWVDGKNVLRFMNFMESLVNISHWDNTSFDVNRAIKSGLVANISKDNSGNVRSNGVIQYILTYFNKYGQESGAVWVSDLVYLSPAGYGGAADETNNNSVTISLLSIDERYNGLRLYSIFRSSIDGTITGYLVSETDISGPTATIIDNGANLTTIDASSLMYIGSRAVVPGTLTHKDEVLFLGDLSLKGADGNFNSIESAIAANMRESGADSWKSKVITFIHSDDSTGFTPDIPYEDDNTSYSYHNQLVYSSSVITGYKGGEKYRFAIRFWMSDGTTSQAFWIGDATNHLYPGIDIVHSKIKRVVARCEIPTQVKTAIDSFNNKPENIAKIVSIQLLMAEATYADRSVKAQGIVNPTMFNTWDRFKNRLYSIPSWISRPRNSGFACRHFSPVNHSSESLGEIACNYWETENVPAPYYQLEGYNTVTPKYVEDFDGKEAYDYLKIIYAVKRTSVIPRYSSMAYIVKANGYSETPNDHNFASDDFKVRKPADGIIPVGTQKNYIYPSQTESISVEFVAGYFAGKGTGNTSRKSTYSRLVEWLRETARLDERFIPSKEKFYDFCDKAADKQGKWRYIDANSNDNAMKDSPESAANAGGWYAISGIDTADTSVATIPALYKKHLMFVDENVITLNSPEIRYEATALDSVDNVNFRIVGIAKITGNAGDYTVDAEHGYLAGNNLVNDSFSASGDYGNIDGLISWPLWNEYGLTIKEDSSEVDTKLLTRYDYDQSLGRDHERSTLMMKIQYLGQRCLQTGVMLILRYIKHMGSSMRRRTMHQILCVYSMQ